MPSEALPSRRRSDSPQPATVGGRAYYRGVDDLSTQLLRADVDVDCPVCGFSLWVRMSEIIAQVNVLCPCCRAGIQLVDDRGGLSTTGDAIEALISDSLKGLF